MKNWFLKKNIVLALIIALVIPSFVFASSGAGITPSNPFYFLDTAFEKVGLLFTFGAEKKVRKALDYAEERIAEAKISASKNKPKAVNKAIEKYKTILEIAISKSGEIKEESKSEKSLTLILKNTLKHQEILKEIRDKVPDEAKIAIDNAIEVSSNGYNQALKEVVKLREEIEQLKKEMAKLKQEQPTDQRAEIDELRKEIEALKKNQSQTKIIEKIIEVPVKVKEEPKKIAEIKKLLITEVSPNQILNSIVNVISVKGKGFQKGTVINIGSRNMTDLAVFVDSETITIRVLGGTAAGIYDLIVRNPDGESFTFKNALIIQDPPVKIDTSGLLSSEEVIKKVRSSVVLIITDSGTSYGFGSGVVIEENGFIITNAHVVEGFQKVKVYFETGDPFDGSVVGRDEYKDLAIIKINGSFQAVEFGDSSDSSLPLTSDVIAIGFPVSLYFATGFIPETVTAEEGDITARGSISDLGDVLQTNALIHKGNSGGPLVNKKAQVIGINTAGISNSLGLGSGIGFAIPSNVVKNAIPALKAGAQVLKSTYTPPSSTPTPSQPTPPSVPGSATISVSSSPSAQNVAPGTQNFTFTNYQIDTTASSENVNFASLSLQYSYSANPAYLTSCKIYDGSTVLNTGSNIINPSSNNQSGSDITFTFDSSLVVPKGIVKTLSLKCNISSNATNQTYKWGIKTTPSATGVITGQSATINKNSSLGNIMTVAVGAIVASEDSASPSYKIVKSGSTGVTMGVINFRSSNEASTLQRIGLTLTNSAASSPEDLVRVSIWDGATQIGTAIFTGSNTNAISTLTGGGITLPKDTDKDITIKVDLANIGTSLPGTQGAFIIIDIDTNGTNTQGVGSSGSTINASGSTSFSGVRMFSSIPTIAKLSVPSTTLTTATGADLYRFSVSASSGGNGIGLAEFTVNIATSSSSVVSGSTIVTNLKVYVYTNSSFSNPVSGYTNGQVVATVAGLKSSSDNTATLTSVLQIPSGTTYYFKVVGDIALTSGSGTFSGSVTTRISGDASSPNPVIGIFSTIKSGLDNDFIWSPNKTTTSAKDYSDWTNGYFVTGLPSDGTDAVTISK